MGNNTLYSKSKLKVFQIPIEKYVNSINIESSLEKKNEIIDLLTNHNHLRSEEEYNQIDTKLLTACTEGDIELIKICLSETVHNDLKDLTFKIDKTNKTASLFQVSSQIDHLVIPRTIKFESTDYLITSIIDTGSFIKSLYFVEDSAVKTIYGPQFSSSVSIEEMFIPASLSDLREGWFSGTHNLNKIVVSPLNNKFKFIEGKYLVGKSDENSEEYDNLLFVRRDIKEFSLPPNIKVIKSCAFSECQYLRRIEFPTNSNLHTIEKYAFSSSGIEEISIPSTVSKICNGAFSSCKNLRKIEFPPNFTLKAIESCTFQLSAIEEISIPSTVTKICNAAFSGCNKLKKVEIPENSSLNTIETSAFESSVIEEIYFPASLNELGEEWCRGLNNLKRIVISPFNNKFKFKDDKYLVGKSDENAEEYDNILFVRRDINEFSLPPNIKVIKSCTFFWCQNLRRIEFPINSILHTIEKYAFSSSGIEEISIPSTVLKICEHAFSFCQNLRRIEFPINSTLQTIEAAAFIEIAIEEISIPSTVIKIGEGSFAFCDNLRKVEIPENSNLQTIEDYAFSGTAIEEIYFPANFSELSNYWNHIISNLKIIVVSPLNNKFKFIEGKYLVGKRDENSEEYDNLLFVRRDIKEFSLPPNIKVIKPLAFSECSNLRIIEFPTNSNLHTIDENAFSNCKNLKKIEFPKNSKLQTIGNYSFSDSGIEEISIPPTVSKIGECAFNYCENLKVIEIPEKSKLVSFPGLLSINSPNVIIMKPSSFNKND